MVNVTVGVGSSWKCLSCQIKPLFEVLEWLWVKVRIAPHKAKRSKGSFYSLRLRKLILSVDFVSRDRDNTTTVLTSHCQEKKGEK